MRPGTGLRRLAESARLDKQRAQNQDEKFDRPVGAGYKPLNNTLGYSGIKRGPDGANVPHHVYQRTETMRFNEVAIGADSVGLANVFLQLGTRQHDYGQPA